MSSGLVQSSSLGPADWCRSGAKSMGTPFGVRSWLWVMAHINCPYGQIFANRSGRRWVTQWPYPWKNGSNKFLQQGRGNCSPSDWALPVALRKLPQLLCDIFDEASQMGTERISSRQYSRRQPNSFFVPVYWILILATSPRSRLLARVAESLCGA